MDHAKDQVRKAPIRRDPTGSRWPGLAAVLVLFLAVLPLPFLAHLGAAAGVRAVTDRTEHATSRLDCARDHLALLPEQERDRSADQGVPAWGLSPAPAPTPAAGRLETAEPTRPHRPPHVVQWSAHRPRGPPAAPPPTIG